MMKIVDKIVDWLLVKLLNYKSRRQNKNKDKGGFIYP